MRKVLIVDDEQSVTTHVSRAFKAKGLETFLAFNGDDAVRVYGREKPDFVLLDLFMPKMDGFQTLGEIRKIDRQARVFMLTAESGEDYLKKAQSLGACGYVLKPLDAERIFDLAARFLKWDDADYKGFFVIGG